MGCGVSKEDFAEPSRIQQVVVRDGSPAKAHEVAAPSTTPLTAGSTDTIISTPCASPVSLVIADVQPETRAQETLVPVPPPAPAPEIPVAEAIVPAQETTPPAPEAAAPEVLPPETPAPDAPPESPEHVLEDGTDGTCVLPYPCESSNGGDPYPCSKSPEPELELEPKSSSVAPGRTYNGLVGTLASLEEILNGQETVSINSKLRVTADKIVSYGGVLRSLEDTVELQAAAEEEEREAANETETAKTPEVKPEPEPEPEPQVESEPQAVPADNSEAESLQTFIGPFENHREEPEHQATPPAAPKKLPPLEAPASFLLDKGTDPFVKAPLPTQMTKSVSATTTHDIPVSPIGLTSSHGPPSPPSPPHFTKIEMFSLDHVKDITVVNGTAEFEQGKCSSPREQPSLEGVQSEDAELDNIILLETLEAGDVDYGSRVNHINHNIRVTSLTSNLGDSSNGQLSPLSTTSE